VFGQTLLMRNGSKIASLAPTRVTECIGFSCFEGLWTKKHFGERCSQGSL